jgi:AcrR family transcriptional regulator
LEQLVGKKTIKSTQDRAVEEAEVLLMAGGYGGMSLEAVAQAIGIRKPSLYHHFPGGKDELFVAVVERRTAEDGQRVTEAIKKGTDTFSRLLEIARYFNIVAATRPYHALNDMAAHLPEHHRQLVRQLIAERVMAPVRSVIIEGMNGGELRKSDPELAALTFVMLMASLGKLTPRDPRRTTLPGFIVEVFAEGLRAQTAKKPLTRSRSPRSG